MKQLFRYAMSAAIAATALVACQKEIEPQEKVETPDAINITVHAKVTDLANAGDTKTYIDENNTIIWGTGEYMKLALTAGENTTFATSTDASAGAFNGAAEATFEFSVNPGEANEYVYQGLYPASAAVTSSNTNAANYKVNLPAIQNATASSYDPAAYIMVAKPETFNAVETDWMASYRRGTALNKITLKNVPSGVSFNKVKITAEGKKLAGGRHFNLTTGEGLEVYGTDATIEVLYATALTGTNVDVWFTSWNAEIAEGEKLTIVAYTTDNKSYTKEITARAAGIKFQEGYLNTLGASLSGITPENVASLDGDYVILAENSGNYFALKGEASGTRIASVDYTGSTSSYTGDAFLVWTIATSGSGYTIKNGSNFIGWTSGNTADLVAEASYDAAKCLMGIDDNGDGTYKIYVSADATRILAKNTSNAYFGFYTGSGYNALILVPATVLEQVAIPTFSPAAGEVTSGTEVTISSATDGATIYYTTDGSTPTTSSTQGTSVTITAATTIKAIAVKDGMANSEVATAEYTVAGVEKTYYVKVTSAPSDWSGTYLIVSEEKAFNGAFSGASTNYGMPADVTVSDNKIESTNIVDAYAVTIAKSGSNYSIETVANGFLSWTSGNSLNHTTSVSGDNQRWSLTCSSGNVTIANANDATRKLQYNSGSPRFACYTSSQQAVQLYKLEGSTTPTPTTYAVTWTAPSNGTITATVGGNEISSGDEFEEGTVVSITANPSTGYKFSEWSITGASLTSSSSASTSFTVGTSAVNFSASFAQDQQTGGDPVTVSMNTFSEISGYVDGDTNVSYLAEKGTATSDPGVYSDEIRIYQNGGTLKITANNNKKITSVTIGSSMATTVTVSVDGGAASANNSISASGTYTKDNIEASTVLFTCTGTSKTSRLYLNYLSVTYK